MELRSFRAKVAKFKHTVWTCLWGLGLVVDPYDNRAQARRYLLTVTACIWVIGLTYGFLHWLVPPKAVTYRAQDFLEFNPHGVATVKSAEDIAWFVGERKAQPVLEGLAANNKEIEEKRALAARQLALVGQRLDPVIRDQLAAVERALERGAGMAEFDSGPDQRRLPKLEQAWLVNVREVLLTLLGESQIEDGANRQQREEAEQWRRDVLLPALERISAALNNQVYQYESFEQWRTGIVAGISARLSAVKAEFSTNEAALTTALLTPEVISGWKMALSSTVAGLESARVDQTNWSLSISNQTQDITTNLARWTARVTAPPLPAQDFLLLWTNATNSEAKMRTALPSSPKLKQSLSEHLVVVTNGLQRKIQPLTLNPNSAQDHARLLRNATNIQRALGTNLSHHARQTTELESQLVPITNVLSARQASLTSAPLSPAAWHGITTNLAEALRIADTDMAWHGQTNQSQNILDTLRDEIAKIQASYGKPASAAMLFARLREQLTPAAEKAATAETLSDLERLLARLDALRLEQWQKAQSLRRPEKYALFWMTPQGCILEVVFWAWFGVCGNMLVSGSDARRMGQFNPALNASRFVKLVYAPMLAVALALALINGLVSVLGEETRVWSMPLLAFLFGYNSRRTAHLVDALGKKVLLQTEKSLEMPAEERLKRDRQWEDKMLDSMKRCASIPQLQRNAQDVGEAILRQIVQDRDRNR